MKKQNKKIMNLAKKNMEHRLWLDNLNGKQLVAKDMKNLECLQEDNYAVKTC